MMIMILCLPPVHIMAGALVKIMTRQRIEPEPQDPGTKLLALITHRLSGMPPVRQTSIIQVLTHSHHHYVKYILL